MIIILLWIAQPTFSQIPEIQNVGLNENANDCQKENNNNKVLEKELQNMYFKNNLHYYSNEEWEKIKEEIQRNKERIAQGKEMIHSYTVIDTIFIEVSKVK